MGQIDTEPLKDHVLANLEHRAESDSTGAAGGSTHTRLPSRMLLSLIAEVRASRAEPVEGDSPELVAMRASRDALQHERDDYASSIVFETTCTNCAHMLDVLAGTEELVEGDGIEAAKTQRIKSQQRALVDLRNDRNHLRSVIDAVAETVAKAGA